MSYSFVQASGADSTNGSGVASFSKSYGSDVTAGNLLVVAVAAFHAITGVSDTRGNAWQSALTKDGNTWAGLFWAIAKDSGPCTVTASGTSFLPAVTVLEFSCSGTISFDAGSATASSGVADITTPLFPMNGADLVVGVIAADANPTLTPGTTPSAYTGAYTSVGGAGATASSCIYKLADPTNPDFVRWSSSGAPHTAYLGIAFRSPAPSVGSLSAVTAGSDTLSATGSATAGSLSATASGDALSGSAGTRATGSIAATSSGDTLSGSAGARTTGSLSASASGDALSASARTTATGSLSASAASDAVAASGAIGSAGTMAATERRDAFSASGHPVTAGSFVGLPNNPTTGGDGGNLQGGTASSGSSAATEGRDRLAGSSGTLTAGGFTGGHTNPGISDDDGSGTGGTSCEGTIARAESRDHLAATAACVVGQMGIADGRDVASVLGNDTTSGDLHHPPASVDPRQGDDGGGGSGGTTCAGTIAAIERHDTFAGTSTVVTPTMAAHEAHDTLAGTAGTTSSGGLIGNPTNPGQQGDGGDGTGGTTSTGSLAATGGSDTLSAPAQSVASGTMGGGGPGTGEGGDGGSGSGDSASVGRILKTEPRDGPVMGGGTGAGGTMGAGGGGGGGGSPRGFDPGSDSGSGDGCTDPADGPPSSFAGGIRLASLGGPDGDGCSCCGSPSCPLTVCVASCGCTYPGATVTVSRCGTDIATCTAGAGGCCSLEIPGAGQYTITVSGGGVGTVSVTQQVACSARISIPGAVSGSICCVGGIPVPASLTLTDSIGTITLAHVSGSAPCMWRGCTTTTVSGKASTSLAPCPSPSSISLAIQYQVVDASTGCGHPRLAVQRKWLSTVCSGTASYLQTTCFVPGIGCAAGSNNGGGITPLICFPDGVTNRNNIVSLTADCSSASAPLAWSGSLTGTNGTADPVGGSVAISG